MLVLCSVLRTRLQVSFRSPGGLTKFRWFKRTDPSSVLYTHTPPTESDVEALHGAPRPTGAPGPPPEPLAPRLRAPVARVPLRVAASANITTHKMSGAAPAASATSWTADNPTGGGSEFSFDNWNMHGPDEGIDDEFRWTGAPIAAPPPPPPARDATAVSGRLHKAQPPVRPSRMVKHGRPRVSRAAVTDSDSPPAVPAAAAGSTDDEFVPGPSIVAPPSTGGAASASYGVHLNAAPRVGDNSDTVLSGTRAHIAVLGTHAAVASLAAADDMSAAAWTPDEGGDDSGVLGAAAAAPERRTIRSYRVTGAGAAADTSVDQEERQHHHHGQQGLRLAGVALDDAPHPEHPLQPPLLQQGRGGKALTTAAAAHSAPAPATSPAAAAVKPVKRRRMVAAAAVDDTSGSPFGPAHVTQWRHATPSAAAAQLHAQGPVIGGATAAEAVTVVVDAEQIAIPGLRKGPGEHTSSIAGDVSMPSVRGSSDGSSSDSESDAVNQSLRRHASLKKRDRPASFLADSVLAASQVAAATAAATTDSPRIELLRAAAALAADDNASMLGDFSDIGGEIELNDTSIALNDGGHLLTNLAIRLGDEGIPEPVVPPDSDSPMLPGCTVVYETDSDESDPSSIEREDCSDSVTSVTVLQHIQVLSGASQLRPRADTAGPSLTAISPQSLR